MYEPSQGAQLITNALASKDWLDPDTLRIAFDLANDAVAGTFAGARLLQNCAPYRVLGVSVRRVRLLAGGQLLEGIDDHSRVHDMMEISAASDSRANDIVEGFGYMRDEHKKPKTTNEYAGTLGGDRQTVMLKTLCGLLDQSKFIPLTYLLSLV